MKSTGVLDLMHSKETSFGAKATNPIKDDC